VASGAGRLLPPQVLSGSAGGSARGSAGGAGVGAVGSAGAVGSSAEEPRVPQQRVQPGTGELRLVSGDSAGSAGSVGSAGVGGSVAAVGVVGAVESDGARGADDSGIGALLDVVGQLVERARDAGELRADVSVGDVLLVIATAAPSLPDAAQQATASARLLDILLEGLRSRPA
jgi:hypothetical protein